MSDKLTSHGLWSHVCKSSITTICSWFISTNLKFYYALTHLWCPLASLGPGQPTLSSPQRECWPTSWVSCWCALDWCWDTWWRGRSTDAHQTQRKKLCPSISRHWLTGDHQPRLNLTLKPDASLWSTSTEPTDHLCYQSLLVPAYLSENEFSFRFSEVRTEICNNCHSHVIIPTSSVSFVMKNIYTNIVKNVLFHYTLWYGCLCTSCLCSWRAQFIFYCFLLCKCSWLGWDSRFA